MNITITKEEAQKIIATLGEAPSKYVYDIIKFFDIKLAELAKSEEEKKAE